MRSSFLGLGLLTALIVGAKPAQACPAACLGPPVRVFAPGRLIPGNLVYFKVIADNPGPLNLKTGDGKEIPANIRMIGPHRVFAPIDPIAADTLVVLTYPRGSCSRDALSITFVFQTSAPLEIQLQPAVLTAGDYGLLSTLPALSSTSAVGPFAFQRLSYGLLDATGAASHLIDLDVTADGVVFSAWPNIEIQGVCTKDIPRAIGTCTQPILGPGPHTVRAQPHIVGQPDPPAAELEIDFDRACNMACPAAPPATASGAAATVAGSPALSDAGSTARADADAPANAEAGHPAASSCPDAALPAPPSAAENAAGGCSATGHPTDGFAPWLVALALVCWRRRRFTRRATPALNPCESRRPC
jgi:uncharacterized protein (TIGR03382 family)